MTSNLALAGLVSIALTSAAACGSGGLVAVPSSPPSRVVEGSLTVMTSDGWNGVHLGDGIAVVARDHGWTTDATCHPVISTGPGSASSSPTVVVASSSMRPTNVVASIAVLRPEVIGPGGLRVGEMVSAVAQQLPGATRQETRHGDQSWSYWTIPAPGGYLFVEASTDGSTVQTFGLATEEDLASILEPAWDGC